MKKVLILLFIVVLLLSFSACSHKHKWKEATCTEPKTCSECGETEGEPLGHDWVDATYTEPKTCSRCGLTEGEPIQALIGSWKAESTTMGGYNINANVTLKVSDNNLIMDNNGDKTEGTWTLNKISDDSIYYDLKTGNTSPAIYSISKDTLSYYYLGEIDNNNVITFVRDGTDLSESVSETNKTAVYEGDTININGFAIPVPNGYVVSEDDEYSYWNSDMTSYIYAGEVPLTIDGSSFDTNNISSAQLTDLRNTVGKQFSSSFGNLVDSKECTYNGIKMLLFEYYDEGGTIERRKAAIMLHPESEKTVVAVLGQTKDADRNEYDSFEELIKLVVFN